MGDPGIKNVVFDFGGVVVGYDPAAWVGRVFGAGDTFEYIMKNLFGSELWKMLDLGLISREEANAQIYEKALADGFGAEMKYVQDNWFENVMPAKEDTVALIRALKKSGVGVYYLTNMPEDLWDRFGRRGLVSLFDGGVASFQVHVTKPDRKIYELLLETCPIDPAGAIFFDDMLPNVLGARAAGIRAEVFTDAAGGVRVLREGGVRLDL